MTLRTVSSAGGKRGAARAADVLHSSEFSGMTLFEARYDIHQSGVLD